MNEKGIVSCKLYIIDLNLLVYKHNAKKQKFLHDVNILYYRFDFRWNLKVFNSPFNWT